MTGPKPCPTFHLLILDGLLQPPTLPLAGSGQADQNVHCACTHYLVFKEPAGPDARSTRPAALPPTNRRLSSGGCRQANLPRLPEGPVSVNPPLRVSAVLRNREQQI